MASSVAARGAALAPAHARGSAATLGRPRPRAVSVGTTGTLDAPGIRDVEGAAATEAGRRYANGSAPVSPGICSRPSTRHEAQPGPSRVEPYRTSGTWSGLKVDATPPSGLRTSTATSGQASSRSPATKPLASTLRRERGARVSTPAPQTTVATGATREVPSDEPTREAPTFSGLEARKRRLAAVDRVTRTISFRPHTTPSSNHP